VHAYTERGHGLWPGQGAAPTERAARARGRSAPARWPLDGADDDVRA
jgi:hypothetical protein